jgi:Cof subfamily protein (haloacid dehalogenase superfamily)
MKSFNVNPMVYKDAYLYVNDAYAYKVKYESRLGRLKVCEVDDLEAYLSWQPNKILTSGDPEYLQENYKLMMAPFKDQLSCMFTADFYFEFTAQGVDKARALKVALNKLNYTNENCIAFGDAQNDLSIINFAKVGVAMGNATDEVKEASDEVTLDNNHDGIYEALIKHIPELA